MICALEAVGGANTASASARKITEPRRRIVVLLKIARDCYRLKIGTECRKIKALRSAPAKNTRAWNCAA
jgi:hypothetical protein